MASISRYGSKGQFKRIIFVDPNGKRRPIYLGDMPARDVRAIATHVEALADAARSNHPPRPDVME
jgi:hypothetical protein